MLAEEERRKKLENWITYQLQNQSSGNWNSRALWNSPFSCKYSNY